MNNLNPAQPKTTADKTPVGELAGEFETASQWKLVWWKFRKHKLAMWSAGALLFLYLVAATCEFFAPYGLQQRDFSHAAAPPQPIRFTVGGETGWRPYVYAIQGTRDSESLRRVYQEDRDTALPVRFLVRGEPYRMWGIFESDLRLFGVDAGGTIHLLGTDSLGRDIFSRILYGARISMSIGLVGVFMSFILGLAIGAISGFCGGLIDNLVQRSIEIIQSFPTIPLWMALAAALPSSWSPLQLYFGITVVLSLVGWTGLARQVRGKILSLREEDFTIAAIIGGSSRWRIMWRHLLPSFMSHIIVSLTLAIPTMILAETALSFLGLGLQPPVTSWGVLLAEAQNVQAVAVQPWLLSPAVFVVVVVLAFNFTGDGLRDAADPYSK